MKRFTPLFAVLLLSFALSSPLYATSDSEPPELVDPALTTTNLATVDWAAFSTNLVNALATDNDGLQQSAMQLIIKYRERVDVHRARFDVMRLYRDHDDDRVRRMAVVTLGAMDNNWALGFLARSVTFEDDPAVRHTIQAVLADAHLR
ncbi:MAG: hypothetical protein GVY18_03410 [Bacteroidetes bacterium]|jgi:hypothetical protein|nr:hypothetical protein [Bacteroidota bacterium]